MLHLAQSSITPIDLYVSFCHLITPQITSHPYGYKNDKLSYWILPQKTNSVKNIEKIEPVDLFCLQSVISPKRRTYKTV